MRLVEDQGAVAALLQRLALGTTAEDQPGGDDADPVGAAHDILGAARLDDVAVVIEPDLAVGEPDRRRDAELVLQLHLPLQTQRCGTEDQRRPVAQQRGDHGARRQRQRLTHPDLVSEQQSRLAIDLAVFEEHDDEGPLPGLQAVAAAIDGRLDQSAGGHVLRPQLVDCDFPLARAAADLLDDRVRQRYAAAPQVLELHLDPGDAFRRGVLPNDLVVLAPALAGLVQAADEGGRRTVAWHDDAGLAMQKRRVRTRDDADLDLAALQQLVKLLVAWPAHQAVDVVGAFVPFLLQHRLASGAGG